MDPIIGPDGQEYTFPEGTSDAEIVQFFETMQAGAPEPQRQAIATAARGLAPQDPQGPSGLLGGPDAALVSRPRTLWERFSENVEDGIARGPVQAAGRFISRDMEFSGRSPAEIERERRDSYEMRSANDPFYRAGSPLDNALAGATTLGGQVLGAAVDPTSWLGGGRTLVTKALSAAGVNAGADSVVQFADVQAEVQDRYDAFQTGAAALIGGGLGALTGVRWKDIPGAIRDFFRSPEADAKVDLEVGDELFSPALTEADLAPPPSRPEGSDDLVRIVKLPDTGEEIILRGDGAPADQVAGGIQPGDYVENGRVWRASQAREVAPVANDNAGVVTEPPGFTRDNPGGEWLAGKQAAADAEVEGRTSLTGINGRRLRGATTATAGLREEMRLPISLLRELEGVNGERPGPGSPKYDALSNSVAENGWQDPSPIMVMVNHRGEAFIAEGNNRVAIAAREGVEDIRVEVHWRNGGEDVDGPFSPGQIATISEQLKLARSGGGRGDGPPPEAPSGPTADAPEPQLPTTTTTRPEADARNPGSGEGGWDDVDWGARRSPERAKAAVTHLDKLRKHIRPEAVEAFVRALDEGIAPSAEGIHVNEKWVDWQSLDGNPEDILGLSNAMADIFKTVFDEAGDKVQTHKQTAAIMKRMGYTYSDLIKTQADLTGEGGLTARAAALQELSLASSADLNARITEVRKAMASGDMSGVPAVAEALQRTMLFSAMDAGVSSEIARAMNFRRRAAQGRFAKNDLQAASDELGAMLNKGKPLSPEDLDRVFDDLGKAYSEGGGVKMMGELRKMQELGFWDYVNYYATASLFSAKTILRNMVGTPLRAVLSVSDRYVAAAVVSPARRALGRGSAERVTVREANAYLAGVLHGMQEGLSAGWQALKTGAPASGRSTVMDDQTANMAVPFAFSRERVDGWRRNLADFGRDPLSPRNWGKLPYVLGDALGVLVFEAQRTVAFRPTVASDEFYKALARGMELNALAYREADFRARRAGPEDADRVFDETLAALKEQPTAEAFREARRFFSDNGLDPNSPQALGTTADDYAAIYRAVDIRKMAQDHAELLTFQQHGPVVDALDRAVRAVPVVKAFWVNFVRTPMAILKAAVVDYNPVVSSIMAAGEMTTRGGRKRHTDQFSALFGAAEDEQVRLTRGGAEAEIVIARQVVGAAILSGLWLYWAEGGIRGRQTEMQRAEGILDYSVRIPGTDEWVQVATMEPLGSMVKIVADTAEALRQREVDDHSLGSIMGALAVAVRNTVVEPTFLTGTMDFIEMLQGGPGGRGLTGAEATEALLGSLAKAAAPRVVPLGGTLRSLASADDPILRDTRGFIDRIMAGLPLLSETLPARRDFMGRPVLRPAGTRGPLAAFPGSTPTDDELDLELARLGRELGERFRIGNTPRQLNGEDLSTVEYSRLLEIQGQGVKIRGRTMEQSIRQLITTPEYLEAPALRQAELIKREVTRYRTEGTEAARNPRSPFYMGAVAQRTGMARAKREAVARGWTPAQTRARARQYGADVEQLDEALFPTD